MTSLSVHALSKRYGRTMAVRDASLEVRTGEILALLGPNGAGKTTLLHCMAGLELFDEGQLLVNQAPADSALLRRTLLLLPDGIRPWADQPADWTLRFACGMLGSARSGTERDDILGTLNIDALGSQPVGTLSKGQRKRLLLAIALLAPQDIVLLDEPFDGLDLRRTRDTIALLQRLARGGRGLLLSIHAMADAERVADRLVLLDDGRTVAEGSAAALRARAGLPDAPLDEVFLALT